MMSIGWHPINKLAYNVKVIPDSALPPALNRCVSSLGTERSTKTLARVFLPSIDARRDATRLSVPPSSSFITSKCCLRVLLRKCLLTMYLGAHTGLKRFCAKSLKKLSTLGAAVAAEAGMPPSPTTNKMCLQLL